MELSFADRSVGAGVECLGGFSGRPDEQGVLAAMALELGDFECACYYAPYQKYDPAGAATTVPGWPDGANRVQPLRVTDFADLAVGGLFLLVQYAPDDILAVLPLATAETYAWLAGDAGQLILNVGNLGREEFSGELPLCAWARAADVYAACRQVWAAAMASDCVAGAVAARGEKAYPEIFNYLGWCSWEEYRKEISEDLIVEAMATIEKSDLPVRFVLIDDGHLDANDAAQLAGFVPNSKFPHGWDRIFAGRSEKIRYLGLWLNFNGYWNGIAPGNKLGDLNEQLAAVQMGALQPADRAGAAGAFYDAMIGRARQAGFDFVKVDNQAKNPKFYTGLANAARCAAANAQALEDACDRHMHGLINCMAHSGICAMNTRLSAVTRCSEDYRAGDARRARRHLHNSYANMLWLAPTVWGDHDMFHSCDDVAGRMMAASRAMSGAPVYLSDNPTEFRRENVWPLCLSDGRLLRPLAPAAPLPDSVFADPFADGQAYRAVAPLANMSAAVAVYNFSEPERPVVGAVTSADYACAAALCQPTETWEAGDEGLVVYDWYAGQAQRLEGEYGFELPGLADRFLLLCPIRHGWAVIGRSDKFLSPAAAAVTDSSEGKLALRIVESGPLAIWTDRGRPAAKGLQFDDAGGGLWRCDMPLGERDVVVEIGRSD